MDFKNLVTLKCVVKLYVSNSSQVPREHSCTFSVGTVDSETCFIVEGPGMRASRVKVSPQIELVAAAKLCFV